MITWLLVDVARGYKARATGACAGAVVGLVVITPAAGYVNVGAALIMGVIGSIVCHSVAHAVKTTRFDDTLDSFSCHGIGGTVGILMTGLFATLEVYPGGWDGGFYSKKAWLFWHHIVMVLIIVPIIVGLSLVCYQVCGSQDLVCSEIHSDPKRPTPRKRNSGSVTRSESTQNEPQKPPTCPV